MRIVKFSHKEISENRPKFRGRPMRFPFWLFAFAVSSASVLAAENTKPSTIAEHDGPRFHTKLTVQECTLTKEQWEKQENGSRILWHYVEIDLVGAHFFHPLDGLSEEVKAQFAEDGYPIPESKVFDGRDVDNPYVSFTISRRDGWSGQQEFWHERKSAKKKMKKVKRSGAIAMEAIRMWSFH